MPEVGRPTMERKPTPWTRAASSSQACHAGCVDAAHALVGDRRLAGSRGEQRSIAARIHRAREGEGAGHRGAPGFVLDVVDHDAVQRQRRQARVSFSRGEFDHVRRGAGARRRGAVEQHRAARIEELFLQHGLLRAEQQPASAQDTML